MKCQYCNEKEGIFTLKNGKICCSKNYQSCDGVKLKSSNKISEALKKQYVDGTRKSHFIKYNDGSNWAGRKHLEQTKSAISKSNSGRIMSESFKENRSFEMKQRYLNGWETKAGRSKKIEYISPIAGKVKLDGTWELAVAKFLDFKKIKWKRNKIRFEYFDSLNKKRTYCPDFYLVDEDIFIEVKGYITELDKLKWDQFPKKLEVWDKNILLNKGVNLVSKT